MKTTKKILCMLLSLVLTAGGLACLGVTVSAVKVGDVVYFGNYPQTKVAETTTLRNAANKAPWRSYDYYSGTGSVSDGNMTKGDFMQFADFFVGETKYRAVRFTKYRPYRTGLGATAANSYQDENGYQTNTIYYFKYEPLAWRVLDPSTGLVLCDKLIDAQPFQSEVCKRGDEYYQSQTSSIYACTYTQSSIASFLSGHFRNTAFSTSQQNKIKTTTVNNVYAYESASDYWISDPTTVRVFLLTTLNMENANYGFGSDDSRKAAGTDYAKCQGLYMGPSANWKYTNYWTRTAAKNSNDVFAVNDYGVTRTSNYIYATSRGVRPACYIPSLQGDTAQSEIILSGGLCDAFITTNNEGGTVSVSPNPREWPVFYGETVTLTATPAEHYTFSHWAVYFESDPNHINNYYTSTTNIQLNGDAVCTAYFTEMQKRNVIVKVDPQNPGGSVSGSGTYYVGDSVPLKVTGEKTGYSFWRWTLSGSNLSSAKQYAYKVPSGTGDITILAAFLLNEYEITVNADGNGKASWIYDGGYEYYESRLNAMWPHGKECTTNARPDDGYYVEGWYDGSGRKVADGTSYTFTVTEQRVLTVKFAKCEPMIAIRNYEASRTVDYRSTITFTALVQFPVEGGEAHWFIDGADAGTGETYTVKEAKKDFNVQVKYMKGGSVITESPLEAVKVKAGFFDRLKAFFRGLFKKLPVIAQEYLGVELIDRILP